MLNKKITISIASVLLLLIIATTAFYYDWLGKHRILIKTDFSHLSGWEQDNHAVALETLQRSCVIIAKKDPKKAFSSTIPQAGTFGTWQNICLASNQVDKADPASARKFFENWFRPYRVYNNFKTTGLFTGYYLPTLSCSLIKDAKYTVPIYATPDDLVKVDLAIFDEKLTGRSFTGQVKDGKLKKYLTRAAITKEPLKNAKVLAWCDNEIDVAFAQIQGSAIVQLPNQSQFLIGYECSNGRTYTAIGKVLLKSGALTPGHSSMQDIRAWLNQYPEKITEVLNQNAAYVFFRVLENKEPLGSQQAPLTPERSLAVDRKYIPLGAPIWLDIASDSFRHLMIAQDVGGAIKGIIRGDVYWGGGERAEFIAGHMKSQGSYSILLPHQ